MANYGYMDDDRGVGNYGALDSDHLQYFVICQHYSSPMEDHRHASPTKDQPISSNYARPGSFAEDQSSDDNPVFSKLRDLYLEYHNGAKISEIKGTEDYSKSNRLLVKPIDDVDGAVKSSMLPDGGRIFSNVHMGAKQGPFTAPVLSPGNKSISPEMSRSSGVPPQHNKEAVEKHDGVDRAIKQGVKNGGTVLQLRNNKNYSEMYGTSIVSKQNEKEASAKGITSLRSDPNSMRIQSHDGFMPNINNKDDYTKFNPPPSKPTAGFNTEIKPSINGPRIHSIVPGAAKQGQFSGLVLSPGKKNIPSAEMSQSSGSAKQHGNETAEKHDSVVANVNKEDDYSKSNPPPSKPTDDFDTAIKESLKGTQILSNVPRAANQGHFTRLVLSPGKKNTHPEMSQSLGAGKQHGKEAAEKHESVRANINSKPMNKVDTAIECTKRANYWGPILSLRKSNHQPEMTQSLKADTKHWKDSRGKFSRTISSYEAVEKYDGALVP